MRAIKEEVVAKHRTPMAKGYMILEVDDRVFCEVGEVRGGSAIKLHTDHVPDCHQNLENK